MTNKYIDLRGAVREGTGFVNSANFNWTKAGGDDE